jgi:hypothetical protein
MDSQAPFLYKGFNRAATALAIDRMKRLRARVRDGDHDIEALTFLDQMPDEGLVQKGHVTRSKKGVRGPGVNKARIDPSERALPRVDVRMDLETQMFIEGRGVGDHKIPFEYRPEDLGHPLNQGLIVHREEGLIPSHPAALAAGQHHPGDLLVSHGVSSYPNKGQWPSLGG